MQKLFFLFWAEIKKHKRRFLLTWAAMALAASLIVWVMGSYDVLISSYDEAAKDTLGQYSFALSASGRSEGKQGGISPGLKEKLQQSPVVQECCEGAFLPAYVVSEQHYIQNPLSHRERMGIPSQGPVLVGLEKTSSPFELEEGRWWKELEGDSEDGEAEGVMGSAAAQLLGVKVGDKVVARVGSHVYLLRLVGIVPQSLSSPDIGRNPGKSSGIPLACFYVSPRVLEKWAQQEQKPLVQSLLYVRLHEGAQSQPLLASLEPLLKQGRVSLSTPQSIEERLVLNRSTRGQKEQVHWALWMTLLATTFIIYTSLSMGIEERVRVFCLLRTLGMTRGQLVGMILGESLIFSLLGWFVGVVIGVGLLSFFVSEGSLLGSGSLSLSSLGLSLLCSLAGGVLAALLPLLRVSQLHPLEPSFLSKEEKSRFLRKKAPFLAMAGACCFLPALGLLFWPSLEPPVRVDFFPLVGVPFLVLGVLLWAPAGILFVERGLSVPLARLLRVPSELLRGHLSGFMGRTLGTVLCLTLGLGLFLGIQTWGRSMLEPFRPNESLPPLLMMFLPEGLEVGSENVLAAKLGLSPEDILACAHEQPLFSLAQRRSKALAGLKQDNVVLLGVETERAFDEKGGKDGKNVFFDLEWKQGERQKALQELRAGRACLIPDSLSRSTGLGVGDVLELQDAGQKEVYSYKIAGVVHIPGWHWLSKRSGLRRQGGFTSAWIFAEKNQVQADYPREKVGCFWSRQKPSLAPQELDTLLQGVAKEQSCGKDGLLESHFAPYCLVTSLESIVEDIEARADEVIWAMCYLPMVAFGLTLLAVGNSLMASHYGRLGEWALLRSLGLSKGQCVRLVLAEGFLLGLVACFLSFFMGVLIAWGFVELSNYTLGFGAMSPPFLLPWGYLLGACGMTLLLCVLCAGIPAYFLCQKSILALFEEGKTYR